MKIKGIFLIEGGVLPEFQVLEALYHKLLKWYNKGILLKLFYSSEETRVISNSMGIFS